jgi:hypothetical protein
MKKTFIIAMMVMLGMISCSKETRPVTPVVPVTPVTVKGSIDYKDAILKTVKEFKAPNTFTDSIVSYVTFSVVVKNGPLTINTQNVYYTRATDFGTVPSKETGLHYAMLAGFVYYDFQRAQIETYTAVSLLGGKGTSKSGNTLTLSEGLNELEVRYTLKRPQFAIGPSTFNWSWEMPNMFFKDKSGNLINLTNGFPSKPFNWL